MSAARDALNDPLVRAGLSFGCRVDVVLAIAWAAVSVPVRWARSRGGRG